ncbi:MAG: histidine phosphatase family protein [Actinomycetaceae bacterium]
MRLLLVRHGETAWNSDGRLQGQRDIGLSERGTAQARELAPLVRDMGPTHVIASPLRRTIETVASLGFTPDRLDERWMEADLGAWTGRSASDLLAAGEPYADWRAGRFTPPGAEPFEALQERVVAAVADLPDLPTVLVVTHGGPIRAVCDRLLGLAPSAVVPAEPASMTILEIADRPRLRSYSLLNSPRLSPVPD